MSSLAKVTNPDKSEYLIDVKEIAYIKLFANNLEHSTVTFKTGASIRVAGDLKELVDKFYESRMTTVVYGKKANHVY